MIQPERKPLLRVRNLKTFFYTRTGIVRAVNGVEFDLDRGEILGIVGESGCGKSMTVRSIMRLVPYPGRIVSGEIFFHERDLLTLNRDQMRAVRGKRIAMVFQDPLTSLNPVLTIERQITETLVEHRITSSPAAKQRAIELMEMVGIPNAKERMRAFPNEFSGGMRQRVMIAIALSCKPELLIADEPTTALDVTIQAQILYLVKTLSRNLGTTVIWVTHDFGVVANICQRVMVMYAGHIVEMGTVRDVLKDPHHPYTRSLLRSIPRLDDPERSRLASIPGYPPSLLAQFEGCPFAPRCELGNEKCLSGSPPTVSISPTHTVTCNIIMNRGSAENGR